MMLKEHLLKVSAWFFGWQIQVRFGRKENF